MSDFLGIAAMAAYAQLLPTSITHAQTDEFIWEFIRICVLARKIKMVNI